METFQITSDQIESSCNRIVETTRGLSSSFNQRCGWKTRVCWKPTYEKIGEREHKLCIVNFPSVGRKQPRGWKAFTSFFALSRKPRFLLVAEATLSIKNIVIFPRDLKDWWVKKPSLFVEVYALLLRQKLEWKPVKNGERLSKHHQHNCLLCEKIDEAF